MTGDTVVQLCQLGTYSEDALSEGISMGDFVEGNFDPFSFPGLSEEQLARTNVAE